MCSKIFTAHRAARVWVLKETRAKGKERKGGLLLLRMRMLPRMLLLRIITREDSLSLSLSLSLERAASRLEKRRTSRAGGGRLVQARRGFGKAASGVSRAPLRSGRLAFESTLAFKKRRQRTPFCFFYQVEMKTVGSLLSIRRNTRRRTRLASSSLEPANCARLF